MSAAPAETTEGLQPALHAILQPAPHGRQHQGSQKHPTNAAVARQYHGLTRLFRIVTFAETAPLLPLPLPLLAVLPLRVSRSSSIFRMPAMFRAACDR